MRSVFVWGLFCFFKEKASLCPKKILKELQSLELLLKTYFAKQAWLLESKV